MCRPSLASYFYSICESEQNIPGIQPKEADDLTVSWCGGRSPALSTFLTLSLCGCVKSALFRDKVVEIPLSLVTVTDMWRGTDQAAQVYESISEITTCSAGEVMMITVKLTGMRMAGSPVGVLFTWIAYGSCIASFRKRYIDVGTKSPSQCIIYKI